MMWTDIYLESKVLAASPVELVQLLYDGAIRFVRDARAYLENGEIANRSAAIGKAIAILSELTASLDHAQGGEISRNLGELYDYMQRRLVHANLHQIDEPLAETLGLLASLSEAWHAIGSESSLAREASTAATAPVNAGMWGGAFLDEQPTIASSHGWTL